MPIRVEQPEYLWLMAAVAPMGLLALAWFVSMSRARVWTAIVLRAALVGLLALALAGVSRVQTTRKLAVVAVVDVSESVRRWGSAASLDDAASRGTVLDRVRRFLAEGTRDRGAEDLLGIVAFDGKAVALAAPTLGDAASASFDVRISGGTNIAAAIELARALVPSDAAGRILLFSDGVATEGDALAAARSAPGVAIDVVPIEYDVKDEVIVESVDAPPNAPAESTVMVRVTLNATTASEGLLRLYDGERALDIDGDAAGGRARRLTLSPGRTIESVQVKLDNTRVHRFRAVYEPDMRATADGRNAASGDTLAENNTAEGFTITPGTGSVLLLDGNASGTVSRSALGVALRSKGMEVRAVSSGDFPGDLVALQAYDLVILENVAAESLSEEAQERLVAYVRDLGGGLIMVGGSNSFGAGGWKNTAIEEVLPVRLDLPDRVVTRQVATIFVIDVSGSMGWPALGSTRTKQEIANESAALAITRMERTDLVGLIAFSNRPMTIIPLGANTDPLRSAARAREMIAEGGTNIGPALDEAKRQLQACDAKIKHIVLLSDGRSQSRHTLPAKADAIKGAGIRLSTIGVGDDADDEMMEEMARRGDGVYYKVLNADRLPSTFLSAIRVVRSPAIRETPFQPIVLPTGSPAMMGLSTPPMLKGLVITQPRRELNVVNAMASPEGEPVLSHWNYELGRVAAFTSDASVWAEEWLGWPGFEAFWSQLARMIMRPTTSRFMQGEARVEGDRVRLRVEANGEDGKPLNGLSTPVAFFAPDGRPRTTRLEQTGPGVYEGEVEVGEAGTYVAIVKPSDGNKNLAPVVIGVNVRGNSELLTLKSDREALVRLAQATGGRVMSLREPTAQAIFDRSGLRPREVATNIWRTLVLAAIGVLLLDIATRRVAWDRWISREYGAEMARGAADAVRDRGLQAAATLEGLRSRHSESTAGERTGATLRLDEEDARRLAEAARDRRRAQRLASVSAATTPGKARGEADVKLEPSSESAADKEGGLLAAKRRAKQRFEEGDS
jgi:uncharacterized membrane protein